MRLPVLLSALALLAACSQPAEAPADAPAPAEAAAGSTAEPMMPADAPPQEEAEAPAEGAAVACETERGSAAAVALASRCTRVSPASHPPCNPANPCQMIQDEIDRSCAMYGPGETKPAECTA
ncbi:hypothetical protein GCM10009422_05350 [Brevundimonas kwangchunensis]|uniref:Uncharacterized protein n=1 Tax=Brevundimonas kwangchunensis TaxID=322163 RepID=A0ABN1GKG5_9CAUL